jgi:hypothetical protein
MIARSPTIRTRETPMALDSNFIAVGPEVFGFITAPFSGPFEFGAVASGSQWGVWGAVNSGGQVLVPPPLLNSYTVATGVLGQGGAATGVAGLSTGGVGVYGQFGDSADVRSGARAGVVGVAMTSNEAGVVGGADFVGVVGGGGDGGVGVAGLAGANGFAVGGLAGPNGVGIAGQASGSGSFAGYFSGDVAVTGAVTINGDLTLTDATVVAKVKGAVVPFPDGSKRLLYCMESPEHWFEDFGTAKLKNGRAVVKPDADFAKVIKRGDYHVFLTPKGDCRGLFVRRQGGTSFEVRELQGGTSSVAFSYRIVGRRKDIRAHRRFAKADTAATARALDKKAPALRALVAGLEKPARQRGRNGARKAEERARLQSVGDLASLHRRSGRGRKGDQ